MEEKVIYKKEITQCRDCPNCKILPMLDICGNLSKDKQFDICLDKEEIIENYFSHDEEVDIPNWCPLKRNSYKKEK